MIFSCENYAIFGVYIPLIVVTLSMLIAIFFTRYLVKKGCRAKTACVPILFWGICMIVLLVRIGVWFAPPLNLVLEPNERQQRTTGSIEKIAVASPVPVYYSYDSNSFRPAIWITVNGDDYYLPYCNLDVGMQVELIWSTDMHIVSQLNTGICAEVDISISEQIPIPLEETTDPVIKSAGIHLARISFAVAAVIGFSQYLWGNRVALWLQEKDRTHKGGIVPSRIGILHFCVAYMPFFGILAGLTLSGFRGALLILIIGGAVFIWILVTKQTTKLTLSGNKVIYQTLCRKLIFETSDFQGIKWIQSGIRGNRCLRLVLQNAAVFDFEQENFWGLDDVYQKLRQRITKVG